MCFHYFLFDISIWLEYVFVQVQIIVAFFPILHHFKGFIMNAGDILQQVDGLTHDKLTYFVRAGYLNPKKLKEVL